MRALVLGGGGVKGAYQAGALCSLVEKEPGLDYDLIAGTSIGGIGASFLASCAYGSEPFRRSVHEYAYLWTQEVKDSKDVFESRFFGWLSGYFAMGLNKTDPLRRIISENIDKHLIQESGRRLRVGVWNASADVYFEAEEDDRFLEDMVLASASFPVMMEPVKIGKSVFADGGVRNNVPNLFLWEKGIRGKLTSIDVILTGPVNPCAGKFVEINNVKDMALRVVNTFLHEASMDDLVPFLNYVFQYPDCSIRILAPDQPLGVAVLDVRGEEMQRIFEQGRRSAFVPFIDFFQDFVESDGV